MVSDHLKSAPPSMCSQFTCSNPCVLSTSQWTVIKVFYPFFWACFSSCCRSSCYNNFLTKVRFISAGVGSRSSISIYLSNQHVIRVTLNQQSHLLISQNCKSFALNSVVLWNIDIWVAFPCVDPLIILQPIWIFSWIVPFKRGTQLYLPQPYPCSKYTSALCTTRVVKLCTKIVYLNSCLMWKVILRIWLYCQWGFFLKCAFHLTAVESYCQHMRYLL